jgi:DNA-binding response OmpR family regulator
MAEAMAILARAQPPEQGTGTMPNLFGKSFEPLVLFHRPIVDTVAMTVTWRGSRCPLGYTRLLDLIERLVRNPGRWLPYERLLKEVWNDDMLGEGTIKVAVTRLKSKLVEHGMSELAGMIRTSGYRCGYFPDGAPE